MNRREALAALMSLPATTRISVASLKPNDVIVLEVEGHISQETADRMRAHLEMVWPDNKVLVLDGSAKLKVVHG